MICPICNNKLYSSHCPNRVCHGCMKNAVDQDGNQVRFKNIDVFGGFKSIHSINIRTLSRLSTDDIKEVERQEHTCYINGVECHADEARFGGILVVKK